MYRYFLVLLLMAAPLNSADLANYKKRALSAQELAKLTDEERKLLTSCDGNRSITEYEIRVAGKCYNLQAMKATNKPADLHAAAILCQLFSPLQDSDVVAAITVSSHFKPSHCDSCGNYTEFADIPVAKPIFLNQRLNKQASLIDALEN